MPKEFPIMDNSDYVRLIQISIGDTVSLSEEEKVSLCYCHKLITSNIHKQWVLTDQGIKIVKAMFAVAKVLTHQDSFVGHIDVSLSK